MRKVPKQSLITQYYKKAAKVVSRFPLLSFGGIFLVIYMFSYPFYPRNEEIFGEVRARDRKKIKEMLDEKKNG